MLAKLNVLQTWVIDFLAVCAGIVAFGIMILVTVDVFMRYFLNNPLQHVFEISGHSLVLMTFLAAPWVLKVDQHVKMEGVLAQFSIKNQHLLNFITSLLGVFICLVLFVFGFEGTWDYYKRGLPFPGMLRIPQYPILFVIVVSYFLLLLQFAGRGYRYFKSWRGSAEY